MNDFSCALDTMPANFQHKEIHSLLRNRSVLSFPFPHCYWDSVRSETVVHLKHIFAKLMECILKNYPKPNPSGFGAGALYRS